jgi:hypothetical protein
MMKSTSKVELIGFIDYTERTVLSGRPILESALDYFGDKKIFQYFYPRWVKHFTIPLCYFENRIEAFEMPVHLDFTNNRSREHSLLTIANGFSIILLDNPPKIEG